MREVKIVDSIYKYMIKRNELCGDSFLQSPFFRVWMLRALGQFEDAMENDNFPCLFGKKSIKLKQFYLFFSSINRPSEDLTNCFHEYTEFVKNIPARDRIYSPLVIFFERNAFSSLSDEHNYAWNVLQELHDQDEAPWPLDVSHNTEDENWSFCFNGVPLFVNISCPKHEVMKSRNLGEHIVLVINPRENFDEVASAASRGGKTVREKIRKRISVYNNGVTPSTLGFYGEKENYEWRQYQLEEQGGLELKKCPLHIRK